MFVVESASFLFFLGLPIVIFLLATAKIETLILRRRIRRESRQLHYLCEHYELFSQGEIDRQRARVRSLIKRCKRLCKAYNLSYKE